MSLLKNLAIGIVFIGVVGVGYYLFNPGADTIETAPDQTANEEQAEETQASSDADLETISPDQETGEAEPASVEMIEGSYQAYSETAFAEADDQDRVLFFHATWCPTCQAADRAFNANLSELPSGVAIFKTDFDQAAELKSRYNIVTQHTFVQVDSSGEEITKWTGGDIAALRQRLI